MADVLRGIRQHGFSQGRWDALCGRWKSICDQGPCGPLRTSALDPLDFYRSSWVLQVCFGGLGVLSDFVKQVVWLVGILG